MCPLKLDLTQPESNVPPLNNEFESNVPPLNNDFESNVPPLNNDFESNVPPQNTRLICVIPHFFGKILKYAPCKQ